MKRIALFFIALVIVLSSIAQSPGVISGNLIDSSKKALQGATIDLIPFADSLTRKSSLTDNNGSFEIANINFGYYKLQISYVGFQTLTLDSIWFRKDRFDFNLSDIILKSKTTSESLGEVVVYAEKPLIQSKEGNITFNAGESALAAGSNASELLQNVPLVTKDPSGKILVRGREPKILIDDKPVELNLQQLQNLLESMPGSTIEKIEVMTNPPPQYANEPGGVINIVTRKGKVGVSGRIMVSGGTRGEGSVTGSFTYRKKGLAINLNAGTGYNRFEGSGYSIRENIYTDSSNYLNTENQSLNKSWRPNFRGSLDYDITKTQSVNIVVNYYQNNFDNYSKTNYTNINQFDSIWKLSERTIHSIGDNYNPNLSLTYTLKPKDLSTFRVISDFTFSSNGSDRDFYQQYFNPDYTPNGIDSTQQQLNNNKVYGYNFRVSYDKPFPNKKTFLSVGGYFNGSKNNVNVDASYLRKPDEIMIKMDILSNYFNFYQDVSNLRASMKQIIAENFSVTAGLAGEATAIRFDLLKEQREVRNDYWTLMPFGNINRNWNDILNMTLSYRKTIRRPGITELNPTVDFSDPYNLRFGNPKLKPSTSHNFDLVFGRTKPQYYANVAFGYNIVQDVFAQVRTLLPDGKTQITYENISGRHEHEVSTWDGYTISKKLKANFSATYIYSTYSEFDHIVKYYRDGGSFTSNFNSTFVPKDFWNLTASFTLNRFANPQGYAKWNVGMNFAYQRKFFQKKLIITANAIDPFVQQKTQTYIFGPNFNLQSFNTTNTRNYRLTVSYLFTKSSKKKVEQGKTDIKNLMKK